MNRRYWIALAISAAALLGFYWLTSGGGPPDPKSLAGKALSAADAEQRSNAVVELAMVKGAAGLTEMRRLAKEATDAKVKGNALQGLANAFDMQSIGLFLDAMEDPDPAVRRVAQASLVKVVGIPETIGYAADDPAEKRTEAMARLRPLYPGGKIPRPTFPAPPPSPPSPEKTADTKPSEVAAAPAPVPPTSAPAPAPPSPSGAPVVYEMPAVHLGLVWMCRFLAMLVLLAEVIGAISLAVGEIGHGRSRDVKPASQGQLSVQEEVEKILARNSTGLWHKLSVLGTGIAIAAMLLIAAEMVQMTALMEQKMEMLSRTR